MSFDNPRMLLALFPVLPSIFLVFFHYHKHRAVPDFLKRSPDQGAVRVRELRSRYFLSAAAFCLFYICGVLALAEPRWGSRLVSESRRGLDVVFAMDLSRSMDVRDVPLGGETAVSRLDRAAALARELVLNQDPVNSGLRFGAAIGKGRGILALPLTDDAEAVLGFLEGISGSLVTGTGTNLEQLIDAAAGAFQDAFPTRRRIILLSDGEALEGSLSAALERALDRDIVLITAGFGSPGGGPVPLGQDTLLDEEGSPVISHLRDEILRNAAEHGGGIYVDGNRSNAAGLLADHLASLSSEAVSRGYRRETKPQWHVFVIAALAALGVSKGLEKGRRKHG
ncbi:MAG: VWA domain-containing protein [Treponema sp.]|jgi:Ca-activated chloride channel family protein|nr:VWA domain-containing protein [Treponema sp.]